MARQMVEVEGLADFRRRLRVMDRDLPKRLRLALNESSQAVVDASRPYVPIRTGKLRKSIRAASTQTTARVRLGGARAPYGPWMDFGGRVGRRKATVRQFRSSGRYLYVTYYRLVGNGHFERTLQNALQRLADDAGVPLRES